MNINIVGLRAHPQNQCGFHVQRTTNTNSAPPAFIISFDKVVTNFDSRWDPLTSMFRAPVKGLYVFHLSFVQFYPASNDVHAYIMHETNKDIMAFVDSRNPNGVGTASVIVLLEVSQRVYVQLDQGRIHSSGSGPKLNFSGYLLYPVDENKNK